MLRSVCALLVLAAGIPGCEFPRPTDIASELTAPANIAASDGTTSAHVRVTWSSVAGATTYDVYRDGMLVAAGVAATSFDDTGADAAGVPAAPTSLTATDGARTADVRLTWSAPVAPSGTNHSYTVCAKSDEGSSAESTADTGYRAAYAVTGYSVHRDNALVADDITATSYDDHDASAAAAPGAPANLAATDGTRTADVQLSWTAAVAPDGTTQSYTVRAKNAAGTSTESIADAGYRGAYAITGYQFSINGTTWESAGTGSSFDDTSAPAGSITPGTTSASDGTVGAHVAATLTGASATVGTSQTYRVRALNATGAGASSSTDAGYRGVGALTYQWERSSADAPASYAAVDGATAATFDDSTAPADGEGRYYRCLVSAAGATSQVTASDRGYRLVPPPSDVPRDFWVPNQLVYATAYANGILYVGGTFTYVGPPTGSFVAIDTSTAVADGTRPRVNGYVNAAAADGVGGWYIGGYFTTVDGIARTNLAHITAAGALDSAFAPNPSGGSGAGYGIVHALAVSGTTVYVGGDYTSIGGQARNSIAALDASTGLATSWNPNPSGSASISALVVSGSTVYAGGIFASIGGQTRNRIAALDVSTGLATSWNPNANGLVQALAVSGSVVYAAGWFTNIGGQARNRIAALDASTGLAASWNPSSDGGVLALAVSGSTVYAGGSFTAIGGQTRSRLAALDASTGLATSWNPNPTSAPSTPLGVLGLAVSGSTVYVGGSFTSIGGQPRKNIAALDASTGQAASWSPNTGDQVQVVSVSGSTVYVGGHFSSVGGKVRNRIAAFDMSTGQPTAWDPSPDGEVYAIAISGSTVYVGGSFFNISGQPRSGVAALDASTGSATLWNPGTNDQGRSIVALAISGSTVYVGGSFTTLGGQTRNGLAAIDGSGGATSWDPSPVGSVNALAVSGSTVYAGGAFSTIGGQPRINIAALEASTGQATSWAPSANDTVYALAVNGSTVYAGGSFTSSGGQTRNRLAALDASTGLATSWNPSAIYSSAAPLCCSPSPSIRSLAVSGSTVYAGGEFTGVGGALRNNLVALDASTGLATPWNPGPTADGTYSASVLALAVSGSSVFAGGYFATVRGQMRTNLAAFEP